MRMLARALPGNKVMCLACARYCRIPEGEAGYCGVRVNDSGKLRLSVYGKPAAVQIDPVEKKPLFHFLPGSKAFSIGTFGCNFNCTFCQNWDISQAPADAREKDPSRWRAYFAELLERCDKWPPERVVEAAAANGCKSIAFTYNEPTIFTEYAIDVMKKARKRGIKGIYVTAGYETRECWDALEGHIDAAIIDLKAYNLRFYNELCRAPNFEPVKESIRYARTKGVWVETVTLFVPGWNDSEKEMKDLASFFAGVDKEMPWHVTAFHPDYKMLDNAPTPAETLIKAREIGKAAGLKHIYCGNLPLAYSDYETTSCHSCGKALIRRYGFEITENHMKEGKCGYCGERLKGVWG